MLLLFLHLFQDGGYFKTLQQISLTSWICLIINVSQKEYIQSKVLSIA